MTGFVFRNLPVDRTITRKNQEGQGSSTRGVLERRDSKNLPARPQSAEPLTFPEESKPSQRRASGLASVKIRRQRPQLEDTQEQLIAVARGGVRYAGKVFHRKGVKLTEDSPRSMLPRNVSQSIKNTLEGKFDGSGCRMQCTPQVQGEIELNVLWSRSSPILRRWLPAQCSFCMPHVTALGCSLCCSRYEPFSSNRRYWRTSRPPVGCA